MAGRPGNPNHDPKTGKFTSSGGLNVVNSTRGQRIKGHIKTGLKIAGAFGATLAAAAATELGRAAIQGATRSIRHHSIVRTNRFIVNSAPAIEAKAASVTSDAIDKVTTAGKTLGSHIQNMKNHLQEQHSKRAQRMPEIKKGLISRKFPKGYSPLS